VITVGALDTQGTAERSDDRVASFSSRGPTLYDLVLKPDVVAPGARIVSARAVGSTLAVRYPERHVGGAGPDGYLQLSGTSMAAGVVSGSVALLLEGEPRLTPRRAKLVLRATSEFLPGEGLVGGGAGSVNLLRAARSGAAERDSLSRSVEAGLPGYRKLSLAQEQTSLSDQDVLATVLSDYFRGRSRTTGRSRLSNDRMSWDSDVDTIIWGSTADTIIWGSTADTIVWGSAADTIVWGSAADTIVWGSAADTIVWVRPLMRRQSQHTGPFPDNSQQVWAESDSCRERDQCAN
jgi:serine protease AprX